MKCILRLQEEKPKSQTAASKLFGTAGMKKAPFARNAGSSSGFSPHKEAALK